MRTFCCPLLGRCPSGALPGCHDLRLRLGSELEVGPEGWLPSVLTFNISLEPPIELGDSWSSTEGRAKERSPHSVPSAARPGLPISHSHITGSLGDQKRKENGTIHCFLMFPPSLAASSFASYTAMVLPVDPHKVLMTQLFPCATNPVLNGFQLSPQAEGQCCAPSEIIRFPS